MKKLFSLALVAALAFVVIGCQKCDDQKASDAAKDAGKSAGDAAKSAGDAAKAAADAATKK